MIDWTITATLVLLGAMFGSLKDSQWIGSLTGFILLTFFTGHHYDGGWAYMIIPAFSVAGVLVGNKIQRMVSHG